MTPVEGSQTIAILPDGTPNPDCEDLESYSPVVADLMIIDAAGDLPKLQQAITEIK